MFYYFFGKIDLIARKRLFTDFYHKAYIYS
jgi:hypothetical protein